MSKLVFYFFLISTFSYAQIVNIPDTSLKNYLINQNCADFDNDGVYDGDVDTNDDNEIQVSEAEAVFKLRASITNNAEGLNSFSNLNKLSLEVLRWFSGPVDLSNLTALEECVFYNDGTAGLITNLNISNSINLKKLSFYTVDVSGLDVTHNINLEWLFFRKFRNGSHNSPLPLDLSQNINLEHLEGFWTRIGDINFNGAAPMNLKKFIFWHHGTTRNMDFSNCPNLEEVLFFDTSIEKINVRNGNNTLIADFDVSLCPNIECVQVDDVTYASNDPDWTVAGPLFNGYTTDCYILNLDEHERKPLISLYPTQINEVLHIDTTIPINEFLVYDIHGKLLKKQILQNTTAGTTTVDVSALGSGIYIVKLVSDQGIVTRKVIKN